MTRRCAFGGFVDIALHFWGKIPPKLQFLGRECAFLSQTCKILKVSCYRKYCIDFNQIWHNDRDHQVVIVGGPGRRPTNPRWRTAAILKKPLNCDRSTDFDEIWNHDACWPLAADQPLKFWIFENPRWRRPPSWKITKIAIALQWFDWSLRNFVRWCKMGLLTSPTFKKFEFHKSKMADVRHFENR